MSQPDLSVVIPVYNRGELIRYTLESVRRATPGLTVETIVVDDGSPTPVASDLDRLGYANQVRVLRQANQGLLFARLAGMQVASGRHILFLDSDDLVAPQKFRAQITAMDASRCEVSYSDIAHCELTGDYDDLVPTSVETARVTDDGADFFINIQPAPHSPIFRTDFLREIVAHPFFPPSPAYNCVAEIWFYHNAAPRESRAVHVPGPLTIGGGHAKARLTNHWERLAVSSLGVMEAFVRSVPPTPAHERARRFVGEKAFRSWRRLPREFSADYERRLLRVWSELTADADDSTRLGGPSFQWFSRLVGPERAGRVFRRWQNGAYGPIRTLPETDLRALLAGLPPP